ncbi:hypothetical protein B0T22DRAFT_211456 [Podospora appendiculata]|uniref:Uncharacterized protein n=1 Tax=Podospora appendiculata TaxID=314037 RepID=A0AAE0X531_9PEZI|nr:hypothetical protein B0T22DRAFT_211456 [Podospora appendiculata]
MSDQDSAWKAGFCDPGEFGDCPRSCFLGCSQFGRTDYRLGRINQNEDVFDLSGHQCCNNACCRYACCCIFGLYVGSGIYTGRQISRVRDTYDIKGNSCADVAKGIFCQPCSLIRNDLEIRRREAEIANLELDEDLQPPLPLGEREYRPLYALNANQAYKSEPPMGSNLRRVSLAPESDSPGREVHFREPGGPSARMVPIYPDQLPQSPQVASLESLEALRRTQLLTPITERDSLEDPRVQQSRENTAPQVHNWLRSMGPTRKDKPIAKKVVLGPGPVSPPTLVPQAGKPEAKKPEAKKKCPEACPKPKEIAGKGWKKGSSKKKCPDVPQAAVPEILVPADQQTVSPDSEPQPVPQQDTPKPTPLSEHDISSDVLVPTSPSGELREHSIQVDPRVPSPEVEAAQEHDLSSDEAVDESEPANREHSLSADKAVAPDEEQAPREHDLDLDVVVNMDESEPEEGEPGEHALTKDPVVPVYSPSLKEHNLESDSRVPTPRLQAREHSLSKDKRVPTPTSKGPFAHAIHLDERVPTPELVWLPLEHNILQDRKVLTPSPNSEEHDLHADQRVKSNALLPARQHSIKSDNKVAGQTERLKEHGIQADNMVASPAPKEKNHSISADNKVAQRAYQLLDHFLEQDRKGSKSAEK